MARTERGGVHLPGPQTRETYDEVIAAIMDAAAVSQGKIEIDASVGTSPVPLTSVGTRAFVLKFTGALGANKTFTVPNSEAIAVFVAENATTGGFDITVKLAGEAGAGVTIENGESALCYHDDVNMKALTVGTGGGGVGAIEASGNETLSGGTATVTTAAIGASSVVLLTGQDNNVTGSLRVSARTPATSFVITSTEGMDSGVVGWAILA